MLYNLQLKGRVTNLFTLGGQEDALAEVGSLSQTMVEARAQKDALNTSEENETEQKLGLLRTKRKPNYPQYFSLRPKLSYKYLGQIF